MSCTCSPADVLKEAWAIWPGLGDRVPATSGPTNAFFEEGFPPNLRADRVPREYVVVEDFGTSNNRMHAQAGGPVRHVEWQYRIRIYGPKKQTLREIGLEFRKMLHGLPAESLCWEGGSLCSPVVSSERAELALSGLRFEEFVITFQGTIQ